MNDPLQQLENLESEATRKNLVTLRPLLDITEQLINFIPTITDITKQPKVDNTSILQHIFLKQALTYLRATSKLLLLGYTTQAATIVCSIYEIYLYSTFIGNESARAKTYMEHKNWQNWVWRLRVMTKEIAENNLRRKGIKFDQNILEDARKDLTYSYAFLCSIKHSNPVMLLSHTAITTATDTEDVQVDYKFGVFPDIRQRDEKMKQLILSEANQKTILIARNTVNTVPAITEEKAKWVSKLLEIQSKDLAIIQKIADITNS